MSVQLDDILTVLCTQFQQQSDTGFQRIYLLATQRDADLVADVLITHGFDIRLYHSEDPRKASKLYVKSPADPAAADKALAEALTYAKALKRIQQELDTLCDSEEPSAFKSQDYSIAFAYATTGGKQMNIQFMQAKQAPLMVSAGESATEDALPSLLVPPDAAPAHSSPLPAAKRTVTASTPRKKYKRKVEDDTFAGGPAVGKGNFVKMRQMRAGDQETWWRRAIIKMTGNAAVGGMTVLAAVAGAAIIFTFFVLMKTWACPDFATLAQNRAWFCDSLEPVKPIVNKPKLDKHGQPLPEFNF